jgi:hypothetical protein
MNRRRFLGGAGCFVVGTAGCLGTATPATSDGIISTEFTVRDDVQMQVEADARVTFQPEDTQVEVRGAMYAGNPCTVATLKSATFNRTKRKLTLTVGTKPTGDILKRLLGCPDSLGVADFTAIVTMESTLPQTVTMTELPAAGQKQRTTVRRDSQ